MCTVNQATTTWLFLNKYPGAEFTTNREILSQDLASNIRDVQSLLDLLSLIEGGQSDDVRSVVLAALGVKTAIDLAGQILRGIEASIK